MTQDKPKIALITGASRGLGKNTAVTLAKNRWVNGQRIEVSGGQSI